MEPATVTTSEEKTEETRETITEVTTEVTTLDFRTFEAPSKNDCSTKITGVHELFGKSLDTSRNRYLTLNF